MGNWEGGRRYGVEVRDGAGKRAGWGGNGEGGGVQRLY